MRSHVRQSQRARIADQLAQDAVAPRQVADHASGVFVDAARQEAREQLTAVIEHAERRVARAGQLATRFDHALKDELQLGFLQYGVTQSDQGAEGGVLHS